MTEAVPGYPWELWLAVFGFNLFSLALSVYAYRLARRDSA